MKGTRSISRRLRKLYASFLLAADLADLCLLIIAASLRKLVRILFVKYHDDKGEDDAASHERGGDAEAGDVLGRAA
jgi:hypothetical protein